MDILIVDDEMSALRVFLDEIIDEWDLKTKFFQDDIEGITRFIAHNKVAAAFLDIKMPRINGVDLAKALIKIQPDIKILFITGLSVTARDIDEELQDNLLGFIYKPYDGAVIRNYLDIIAARTPVMHVKTMGAFDCTVNGRKLMFSSAKSKELLALLVVYAGKTLTMNTAIAYLWPDHDLDRAKKLYRDAVWRLRKSLREINFSCVNFSRAELSLSTENIKCDLYDYLKDPSSVNDISEAFLPQYEWSLEYINSVKK